MTTKYPAQIDTSLTLPTVVDNQTPVAGAAVNRLRDAIIAVQAQLGVKPAGTFGTVRARLDALESAIASASLFAAAGDLTGTSVHQIVVGLQGNPVSATTPNIGEVLAWSGTAWEPELATTSTDLFGTSTNGAVIHLLDLSSNPFILENNNAYTIKITILANRTDDPGNAMWIYDVLAHCSLNKVVVDNYNLTFQFTNGNNWTTNIQYNGSSNHIDVVFTGSLGQTIDVKASIEFTKLAGFIVTEDMTNVLETEYAQSLMTESGQFIIIDV